MQDRMVTFMRNLKPGQQVELDRYSGMLSSKNGYDVDIGCYQFSSNKEVNRITAAHWWVSLEFNSYLQAGFHLYLNYVGLRLPNGDVVFAMDTVGGTFDLADAKYPPDAEDDSTLMYVVIPVLLVVDKHSGEELGEAAEFQILEVNYRGWGNQTPLLEFDFNHYSCCVVGEGDERRIEIDLSKYFAVPREE